MSEEQHCEAGIHHASRGAHACQCGAVRVYGAVGRLRVEGGPPSASRPADLLTSAADDRRDRAEAERLLATSEVPWDETVPTALADLRQAIAGMPAVDAKSTAGPRHALDRDRYLLDRVDEIERRVAQLEAPDPLVGRRCRVPTWTGQPAGPFVVVHVDWDGTLLVRGVDSDPSWQPMRVAPGDVEWLDDEPAAQPDSASWPQARDAFIAHIEREFDWSAVTARWYRETTAKTRAGDREAWLVGVIAKLYRPGAPGA